MPKSLKNTFTKTNLVKIAKGAGIAAGGAAALFVLDFLGTVEIDNELVAAFFVWFVPVATNAVKEFCSDR